MSGRFEGIVIASDMDGTYIARTESGERRNREAIEYFKANGGHFTFATGRSLPHLLLAESKAAEVVNLPVISSNGALLYDLGANREIAAYPIDHRLAYKLQTRFSELATLDGNAEAWRERYVHFNPKTDTDAFVDGYRCESVKSDVYELMPSEAWERGNIYKCLFVGMDEAVTNMRKRLDREFEDSFEISQSSPSYYEFNAKGVSKAAGIANLLKLTFGDRKMTLCVAGDFDNDIEMLKSADYAFCPENANDRVKAICHKCFCHHKEGLIADIIEYLDKEVVK